MTTIFLVKFIIMLLFLGLLVVFIHEILHALAAAIMGYKYIITFRLLPLKGEVTIDVKCFRDAVIFILAPQILTLLLLLQWIVMKDIFSIALAIANVASSIGDFYQLFKAYKLFSKKDLGFII